MKVQGSNLWKSKYSNFFVIHPILMKLPPYESLFKALFNGAIKYVFFKQKKNDGNVYKDLRYIFI